VPRAWSVPDPDGLCVWSVHGGAKKERATSAKKLFISALKDQQRDDKKNADYLKVSIERGRPRRPPV
jgi:hypothetical protein